MRRAPRSAPLRVPLGPVLGPAFGLLAGVALVGAAGCGTSASGSPGWVGAGDGGYVVESGTTSSPWPTSDPDPDGGTHEAPTFGPADDAGVPPPPVVHCTGKTAGAGDRTVALTSGGLARSTFLHVPKGYDPKTGAMLVLSFHGFTSNAAEQEVITRMNPASDTNGFLVAYPDGVGASWNAGDCCGTSWTDSVDDVGFVKDLLARLERDYCVDPKRVYATGFSNGGFLAYRLACEMADTFAAIAPVSGVQGIDPDACRPSRPVPVLHFHGTSDPIVPYNGGTPGPSLGVALPLTFRSVDDTLAIWMNKDGCSGAGTVIYQKGDATCTDYGPCQGGAQVTKCKLAGDGHTWPGGVPIPFLGSTSNDLSATDAMVSFFNAHPMP